LQRRATPLTHFNEIPATLTSDLRGETDMGEATAMKKVEEPLKPTKLSSLFDQAEEILNALTRRAYEIFDRNGRRLGHDLEHWLQAEREMLHPVPLNIVETLEAFEVKAEVPGFSEKELEIAVEQQRLTITGKREFSKEENVGKTVYAESSSDQLLRIVDLPADVEAGKVTATLKNGILQLTLPKVVKAQPVRVHPKAA
jgi:HSP20 family protein